MIRSSGPPNDSDVFDDFLAHEAARVQREDLAPITLAAHRQILERVWRPAIGALPFLAVRYSMLVKVVDAHRWTKKTHNNVISALRRCVAYASHTSAGIGRCTGFASAIGSLTPCDILPSVGAS